MPVVDVVNLEGKKVGQVELADSVFGAEVNRHLLHEASRGILTDCAAARPRQGKERSQRRRPASSGGKRARTRACWLDPFASWPPWRHRAWTPAALV